MGPFDVDAFGSVVLCARCKASFVNEELDRFIPLKHTFRK